MNLESADQLKQRAALVSVFASVAITIGKLVAGLLSGSLALLSEASHAAVDTCATILTLYAVKQSSRPADEEHHYGHGKFEALAALIETGLLFALTAYVSVEATRRLIAGDHEVTATPLAFAVLLISIVIDATRWRSLSRIAKETRSEALAADALHFSSDMVGSILVLAGLTAAALGYPKADALASYGVAAFVGYAGYRLSRRTLDTLLDAAPKGLAERLRVALARQPGVVAVDEIRLRPVGPKVFGEISLGVPRTASLDRVARIKERAAATIREAAPDSDVAITTRPILVDNETALERVMLAAGRMRLSVHHITVQQVDCKRSVSLDLELDRSISLREAHEIASRLEEAIGEEIGPDVEVDTHIEPIEFDEMAGVDAEPALSEAVRQQLESAAARTGLIEQVHNVRVRRTDYGLIVNYHCRLPAELTVRQAHEAVDRVDRELRASRSDVIRVVGHAEPLDQSEPLQPNG